MPILKPGTKVILLKKTGGMCSLKEVIESFGSNIGYIINFNEFSSEYGVGGSKDSTHNIYDFKLSDLKVYAMSVKQLNKQARYEKETS